MRFSTHATIAAFLVVGNSFTQARCHPKGNGHTSGTVVVTKAAVATSPTPTVTTLSTVVVTPSSTAATTATTAAAAVESSSGTTTPASGLTTDEQNALDAHNAARSAVGEAALTWDATLASAAQTWANHLGAQGPGILEHDTTGENLYWQSTSDNPFTNAANAWIAEKSSYNGEAIPSSGDAKWMHYCKCFFFSSGVLPTSKRNFRFFTNKFNSSSYLGFHHQGGYGYCL